MTTILSIAIGYPVAYWISRYGGRNKALLLILVMLPFWTSYLIRTYAWMIILRDNGVVNSILHGLGLTTEPDHPAQHRPRGDPRHDLRLPAVRDPAAVRVDRPARRRSSCSAARDLYASGRGAFLHVILPLTMPGHHRRGAADVHPGDRRLRHAGPARRGADDDGRQGRPDAVPVGPRLAAGLGPRVHPDGGHVRSARSSRSAACGPRCCDRCAGRGTRCLSAYALRRLRLPVPADRDPDHLQLQRRQAELQLGRVHARLVSDAVLERADPRRPRGHAPGRGDRGRSRRSPSGRCSGLGLARIGQRWRGPMEVLLLLPMVTPEIVMGISLLLFFATLFGGQGSFSQISIAHITFCVSYVAIIVRARAIGLDPHLEEAGPRPRRVGLGRLPARDAAAARRRRSRPGR